MAELYANSATTHTPSADSHNERKQSCRRNPRNDCGNTPSRSVGAALTGGAPKRPTRKSSNDYRSRYNNVRQQHGYLQYRWASLRLPTHATLQQSA